jgi:DNA-binding transcriptional LysR family regulator
MSQRNQNIPIEIFRTIVAILETGSLTKASLKLGLSQPAVSSQIKRIETIVGGPVFHKTSNGSSPTELGKLVILHARKILDANDQTMALGGASAGPVLIRVGLSSLLVRDFMAHQTAQSLSDVQIVSDNSAVIARMLLDNTIDIACVLKNPNVADVSSMVVAESEDELIWVRSKDFVLSPGAPIPIITWSGDDWMTTALERNGLAYRIAFNGQDFDAKKSAVEAGVGITALPKRLLPECLMHANEYYLPKLGNIISVLCVRPDAVASPRLAQIRESLSVTYFGRDTARVA